MPCVAFLIPLQPIQQYKTLRPVLSITNELNIFYCSFVCISHSVISQGLMVACCFVTDVVGTVVGVWAEVGRWCLASTELSQFFTLFKSTSAPLVSMLSLPSKFHCLYLILQMFTKVISLLCQNLHIIV